MQNISCYLVDSIMGRGQFSVVWRAIHLPTQKPLAIKNVCILPNSDNEEQNSGFQEINILKQLNHPNIICYIDSFVIDNELNIILELADAGNLSDVIKSFAIRNQLLSERTIFHLTKQICCAIEYIHSKDILHRDLKPANILLTFAGILKLADFGFACQFTRPSKNFDGLDDTTISMVSSLVGTPHYMSPERIQGHSYSFPADIWSLGCVVFELANQIAPFVHVDEDVRSLSKKILSLDFPALPTPYICTWIQPFIEQCFQAMPENRPSACTIRQYVNQQRTHSNASTHFVLTEQSSESN